MLAGEFGEPRRWAHRASDRGRRVLRCRRSRAGRRRRTSWPTPRPRRGGRALSRRPGGAPDGERRVRVPTMTDPRGLDFAVYKRLGQTDAMRDSKRARSPRSRAFGVLMTDTCINYQTIMPPVRGEHLAMGDTGVVIYSNSVFGARSNFEGGPSALAAGLTGRTPRYGYHLDAHRAGTEHFAVAATPRDFAEWGALGGIVGRAANSYWQVPVDRGVDSRAELRRAQAFRRGAGELRLGRAVPYARHDAGGADAARAVPRPRGAAGDGPSAAEIEAFYAILCGARRQGRRRRVRRAATVADRDEPGRRRARRPRRSTRETTLLVATSPEIKYAADRMGLTRRIEACRRIVAAGICFYQSYAGEMAEANGWQRLLTNSAKLVNIIGGYGYKPDAGEPGALRRLRGRRDGSCDADRAQLPPGHRPGVTGTALVAKDNFSARYDLDRKRASSRARATRCRPELCGPGPRARSRPRAASRPPGCCTR